MADSLQAAREWPETERAFDAVRKELIDRLLETEPEESLLRDKLVLSIQAMDRVRAVIMGTLQDGQIQKHIEALSL